MKKLLAALVAFASVLSFSVSAIADPVDPNTLAAATVTLSPSVVKPGDTVTVTINDPNGNICASDVAEDGWVISLYLIDKLTYSPMNVAENRFHPFYVHGAPHNLTFTFVMPPLNSADNPAGPAEYKTYTYRTICWIGLTEPYTGAAPRDTTITLAEHSPSNLAETGQHSSWLWLWLVGLGGALLTANYLRVSRKH